MRVPAHLAALALLTGACQGAPSAVDASGSTLEDASTSSSSDASSSTESSSEGSSSTSEDAWTTDADASESGDAAVCGDGILGGDEECDTGEENGGSKKCTPDCTVNVCGDGWVRDGVEQCDDGPATGDGVSACSPKCRLNDCGDGYPYGSEECDVGILNGTLHSGCSSACTLNVCGDGYTYSREEECDDGNAVDTDYCPSTCMLAFCGDGFLYADEEHCDDGAANGDGSSTCRATCVVNSCGDGYLHESEGCDDGWDTGDGVSECTPDCTPNACGDGYRSAAVEDCDPGVPTITCTQDCTSVAVPVVAVSVGYAATCVVFEPGVVRCWGRHWPVDYSDANDRAADVPDLDVGGTVAQLSVSDSHACAVLSSGELRCWGRGYDGQLGYGNTNAIGDDETPAMAGSVDVDGVVVQVAAGGSHTCALLAGGDVRCWGYGAVGALGYANTDAVGDDETPASIGTVDVGGTVVQLSAGGAHTCALLHTGTVRCWGYNEYGQLGYGNTEHVGDDETPASVGDVDIGGPVVQLAAGMLHTCAVLEGGSVRCWGWGDDGRLGYAATTTIGDDETPASVGDVDVGGGVVRMAAGVHTCAVLDTHALRCWGSSSWTGQLGYGDYVVCDDWWGCHFLNVGDDETPASVGDVPIAGDFGVEQVAVGENHTCAVLDGGALRCWGGFGQPVLGYGDDANKAFADEDVPL